MDKTSFNYNFCDLPTELSTKNKALFLILPLPYEATTTYRQGTHQGPEAIIAASRHLEWYDEELQQETCTAGIHTLAPIETTGMDPVKIYERARKEIKENKVLITLGGEHSISTPLIKAHKEKYPNLSVLHLDAHADMRDTYRGDPLSHACVARRISEIAPLVSVGIRSLSRGEAEFSQETNKKIFWGKEALVKTSAINSLLTDTVYLSLDIDILDPSIMPATGTPEPDGWLWSELTTFLKNIILRKKIVGLDIVELAPLIKNIAPDFTVAKLIYKIMGYITKEK